jgi:tetratricopeptide (TPR) repeat protein
LILKIPSTFPFTIDTGRDALVCTFGSTRQRLAGALQAFRSLRNPSKWLSFAALLIVVLALPASSGAQQQGNVILDGNEQLFCVLAALNASGYDTGMTIDTGNNTREVVREFLAKKKIPVLGDIRRFYLGHKIPDDPGADLGQYVSLALLLGPAPDFKTTVAKSDLPPDAKDVADLIPLLKTFYQQADLLDLWSRLQTRYQAEILRYDDPVRSSIQVSDAYLRFPSGAYLGRTYSIFLDLLGAPNQVQARIYGMNYFLVITPSKQTKLREIRYQYLHFLLDPLAVKYAPELNQKADLRLAVRQAPMLAADFKEDFPLLLTECLIHAAELRMDKQPKAEAEKSVQDLTASGLLLTPYFYSALADYEQQDTSISVYYKSMIAGIDVQDETAKAAKIKFTPPPVAAESKKPPARTEEESLLNGADNSVYLAHYDEAKTAYLEILEKINPKSERALYGLAAVYTYTRKPDLAEEYFKKALDTAHDLRIATWSHIYLGRIYDLKGKRDDALAQYRAASVTATAYPEALRAVQAGLVEAYGSRKTKP